MALMVFCSVFYNWSWLPEVVEELDEDDWGVDELDG